MPSAVGETPTVTLSDTLGDAEKEHTAITSPKGTGTQADKPVLSSGMAAGEPPGSTGTSPGVAAAQPDIPFAPSSAKIPFESSPSAVMLQLPSKGSGQIDWESPRPAVPEQGAPADSARKAENAVHSAPLTTQPDSDSSVAPAVSLFHQS